MTYLADPGNVFDSDAHRRVLGHLTADEPMDAGALFERMVPDVGSDFDDQAEIHEVLKDLEADGYATETKAGWKHTKRGYEALNK